jgi:hypothetical protein
MSGNRTTVFCTLFISGWMMFLGSAFFDIMGGHFLITSGRINKIFYVVDILPYLGLLFVFLPVAILILKCIRKRKLCTKNE